ncbi:MAG: response regulator [Hyphomonadaceae bacterium]
MKTGGEKAILKVLVVDDQPFQRRLIADTLRAIGAVRIEQAASADEALRALSHFAPNLIITDWDMAGGDGLELARKLRSGAAGPLYRNIPIIMAADRNKTGDIEIARNSGVDEFVLKPFTTKVMVQRVRAVQAARRDFVESVVYTGPCRRRRRGEGQQGPRRRLFDAQDANADAPEVQIRKGLARMYAERIQGLAADVGSNAHGMRDVTIACAQLNQLSADMADTLLMSATSSLFSYCKGVGAEGAPNMDVLKAHLDAIVQLAELPNSQYEIRATVTRELGVLVTKKLRAAANAA